MTVTEGPAISLDNPIVPIASWPFAYQLGIELDCLGVHCAFEQFEEGAKIGQPGYRQFHVLSEGDVAELATHIADMGKFVVFGNLWMPPNGKGVIYAGAERHGNVFVRRLVHYFPATDDVVQRYDVIVKSAMPE